MQDIQNIPNPDVNSTERDDDFGSHSDIEQGLDDDDAETGNEEIPVPPDRYPAAPIEEPPGTGNSPIGEVNTEPKRIT